jgi:RNA polymerase sigma factor (TIGR02999 family)
MAEVTQILSQIEQGDLTAAERLLPLVYAQLRKLAASKLAQEMPGQTLQPTALVHEAYLRLVDVEQAQRWENSRHFFAAAGEAMRRILVENARRKGRSKRQGGRQRVDLNDSLIGQSVRSEQVVALDEALSLLEQVDVGAAQLVKLRFFVGMTLKEAANSLGISERTAFRDWSYARAWLYRCLTDVEPSASSDPR